MTLLDVLPSQQLPTSADAVLTDAGSLAAADTFRLHSNPAGTLKIYLDFDGQRTTASDWNSYWNTPEIVSPPFSLDSDQAFSDADLTAIRQIWQRVAALYEPFTVDVTTEDPGTEGLLRSGAGDTAYGIRIVVTDEAGKDFGGISYVGSFGRGVPSFVYADRLGDSVSAIAAATAHEAGHSLGLSHDGIGTSEYYYGNGTGATAWAPIMGVGYGASILQFSKGDYAGATQVQDDLAIITGSFPGLSYRADEAGDAFGNAAVLKGQSAGGRMTVSSFGIITGSGARNDIDMYVLHVAPSGDIDLAIHPATQAWLTGGAASVTEADTTTSLDLKATLYDANHMVVLLADDPGRLDAQVTATGLAGGTYYLAIDGTGLGDPMATPPQGYTEYGSLGGYLVTGSYSAGPSFSPADFDRAAWYLHTYPDVAAAHVDPVQHYDQFGWREGRDPQVLFDTRYYLQQNPDVAQAGVNPYRHFLDFGWREGRDPSPSFDTSHYLTANPDVAAAHVNPLLHFEQYGFAEGRAIWPV